jgi:hypothetical protein
MSSAALHRAVSGLMRAPPKSTRKLSASDLQLLEVGYALATELIAALPHATFDPPQPLLTAAVGVLQARALTGATTSPAIKAHALRALEVLLQRSPPVCVTPTIHI